MSYAAKIRWRTECVLKCLYPSRSSLEYLWGEFCLTTNLVEVLIWIAVGEQVTKDTIERSDMNKIFCKNGKLLMMLLALLTFCEGNPLHAACNSEFLYFCCGPNQGVKQTL